MGGAQFFRTVPRAKLSEQCNLEPMGLPSEERAHRQPSPSETLGGCAELLLVSPLGWLVPPATAQGFLVSVGEIKPLWKGGWGMSRSAGC